MKWILYATDGSRDATDAGRFLAAQSRSSEIHVHVLTVQDPSAAGTDTDRILASAVNALGRFPLSVTTATARAETPTGVIAAIDSIAANIGADLIAVGSRGLSTTPSLLLGSVSHGIARTATCPVLVAKAPVVPLRAIVIGIDASAESLRALHWVQEEMPRPQACEMLLVHAATQPETGVRESREALSEQLRMRYGVAAEFIVPEGEASGALIAIAKSRAAGLIVTGVREISGIDRLAFGSVTESLLRHSPCSLLIVKR